MFPANIRKAMDAATRKLVVRMMWVALVCCLMVDGALGEGAISGCCDVAIRRTNGEYLLPGPEPKLWIPIAGMQLIQGILIAVLIRLRRVCATAT